MPYYIATCYISNNKEGSTFFVTRHGNPFNLEYLQHSKVFRISHDASTWYAYVKFWRNVKIKHSELKI